MSRNSRLPPLELLVAFEAAARHLSFTQAADEVALTQSAVSRQIQALEESLGVPLFRRLHRALVLTDEGLALQQASLRALDEIERATRAIRSAGAQKTVVVTTTAGFAGLWLIPRLSSFVAGHADVDVRISTGYGLAQLDRDGVDVAVRYQPIGSGGGTHLFGESVSPVCSPRLLKSGPPLAAPADLARHTLLRMEPDGSNPLHDWGLWLQAMQLAELKPAGVLHFSSYDQLIQAAVAGQGVALGRMPLIESLLKSRKLVAPFDRSVASPRGYSVLVGSAAASKPEVRAFTAWLLRSAPAPRAPEDAPAPARRITGAARGPGSAAPKGRARA